MSDKKVSLDFPSPETIAQQDIRKATLLGAINRDVVSCVADLEKIDPRYRIIRIGDAERLYNAGIQPSCDCC